MTGLREKFNKIKFSFCSLQLPTSMKYFWTILSLLWAMNIFAQPLNDNCDGLIDLGVAPACTEDIYTNVDATASDIGIGNNPTCFNGGTTQNDVWFAFTTSDTIFDYTISVMGTGDGLNGTISSPQIALYRGDCVMNGLAELFCASADLGEFNVSLDALGLTPNVPYFIRVNDYSSTATPNWGDFTICVDEVEPISTIDEEGSTACSGELFDSGGPEGDYGPNENLTFTICPDEFHNCILFHLDFYNMDYTFDFLRFYDGENTNPGNLIGEVTGGGVDFNVQASSGCLTVEFISDGFTNFEGFGGSWTCTAAECDPITSIQISPDPNEAAIMENLATPQTTISNIVLNCPEGAAGTFQAGDNTGLALEKGIILTSGAADLALGPNIGGGTGLDNPPFGYDDLGDADLNVLSPDLESKDACALEFDVFVATNELTFNYVFGSDEYPEFANDLFNDIFAFLISGPGITGEPGLNGQENIAVLEDGTPVTINSINQINNWQYYKDNSNGLGVEYDGLIVDEFGVTGRLTARSQVKPCNTYHLKLVVADRFDEVWDSGVFISELKGGTPSVVINFNSGIDYLLEDCTSVPDELMIELSTPLEDTTTYILTIGGTATPGEDYNLDAPMSITFLPGETTASFPLEVLSDDLEEGTETIEVTLSSDFGCGVIDLETVSVEIRDALDIVILTGQDSTFTCQDSSIVLEVMGASNYFWTPVAVVSDPTSPTTTATPEASQWIYVEGTVGANCVDNDSIFVEVLTPEIEIQALSNTMICEGDEVEVLVVDNVDNLNLSWTPEIGVSDPNSPTPTLSPSDTTTYFASVNVAGCIAIDTIEVLVDDFDFPEVINDTTVCQNHPLQLAEMIDSTTTTYSWTPEEGLNDPTVSGPIALSDESISYSLTATSATGLCIAGANVNVTILEADVEVQNPDTLEICLGDSIELSAVNSNNGLFSWTPSDSLSSTTDLTVTANPSVSTWYYANLQTGECAVIDSVFVRVDSLPNDLITAVPDKETYCEGEVLTLISTPYDAISFPDIEHQWTPQLGLQSDSTNWNIALIATTTTTYIRNTVNRACQDTAAITIEVIPMIDLVATPDTTLCPGDMLQLEVTSDEAEDFEWTPSENLSCADCPNPIVTATTSEVTYTASATIQGCAQQGSVTITPANFPLFNFPATPIICLGNSLTLNLLSNETTTYTWTSPDDPTYFSSEPAPTVTPNQTTTYILVATADCGTEEASITVEVVDEATLMLEDDLVICEGESFTLEAVGSASGNYTWTWGDSNISEGATLDINPDSTTTYYVTYSYGNNCGTLMDSITVMISPTPMVTIESEPDTTSVIVGTEVTLTAIINPEQDVAYEWTENGTILPDTTDVIIVTPIDNPSVYTVTVISEAGCIGTVPEITFETVPPAEGIPNVFTPNNGDDLNNTFNIFSSVPFDVIEFKVYNRWGQLVYNNETPAAGWDGTYNGNLAPSDVYLYYIRYSINGIERAPMTGDVTLIR